MNTNQTSSATNASAAPEANAAKSASWLTHKYTKYAVGAVVIVGVAAAAYMGLSKTVEPLLDTTAQ